VAVLICVLGLINLVWLQEPVQAICILALWRWEGTVFVSPTDPECCWLLLFHQHLHWHQWVGSTPVISKISGTSFIHVTSFPNIHFNLIRHISLPIDIFHESSSLKFCIHFLSPALKLHVNLLDFIILTIPYGLCKPLSQLFLKHLFKHWRWLSSGL
jgi:hypothetical protein